MKILRLREVVRLAQGHAATKYRQIPSKFLAPNSMLITEDRGLMALIDIGIL